MSKSKTIAYVTWAVSNALRIAKDYTNKGIDYIASRKRFDVEITLQGVVMESRTGLTATEIIALLDTMSHFGNVQIHVTNSGGQDDNINTKQQSGVHSEPEDSSDDTYAEENGKETIHTY